jgi:hypothetical protein
MAILVVWLVIAVVVIGGGLLTWRLGWERYANRPDAGPTQPTDEVLVDPETGRRQRVHMNPATGARVYVDEPMPPGGPGPTR